MMTLDEIKSLAIESVEELEELAFGMCMTWNEIERFAYLIADVEREKCAKLFDKYNHRVSPSEMAKAIRARGQE